VEPKTPKATRELRARVEAVARQLGTSPAARRLGMSRESMLGIIAGTASRAGTLALARERLPAIERSLPPAPPERSA